LTDESSRRARAPTYTSLLPVLALAILIARLRRLDDITDFRTPAPANCDSGAGRRGSGPDEGKPATAGQHRWLRTLRRRPRRNRQRSSTGRGLCGGQRTRHRQRGSDSGGSGPARATAAAEPATAPSGVTDQWAEHPPRPGWQRQRLTLATAANAGAHRRLRTRTGTTAADRPRPHRVADQRG
jgi:hypothetical protein